MSSIPLPALRLRHPKFEGPLDQYRKVVQLRSLLQGQQVNQARLKNLGQRQQLNQLQLQKQQQAQQDQAKFRQCYMEAEGNPEKTIQLCSRAGVSHKLISQYRDSITQSAKALADLDEAGLDNAGKRIDMLGSAFQAVLSQPENQRPQAYAQGCAQLIQAGVVTPEQCPQQYPGNEFLQIGALGSMSSKDQIAGERQRRLDARNAPEKVYDFLARTMGTVRSQIEWTAKRNFVQARLKRMGVSEDYLDLIPEEYSPEAAQRVKQLGITPKEEKKPSTPFAAFASDDPEQKKLARQWTALQNRYRRAMGDGAGLTPNQKRQVDSINSRFNREMEVIQAQITFEEPTEEQTRRMEGILRKANEDYDAVLSGEAPKGRAAASTGRTATGAGQERFGINPETGERVVLKGGKWVPVPK